MSLSGSAFTTDTPTPWRPPETLKPSPPNLPPACNLVITISTAGRPNCGITFTGMPRPSSVTCTEASGLMVIWILEQCPWRPHPRSCLRPHERGDGVPESWWIQYTCPAVSEPAPSPPGPGYPLRHRCDLPLGQSLPKLRM